MSSNRLLSDPSPGSSSISDLATDIDMQTALALVRANSRALRAISADSHRHILDAISDEIRMQETQQDAVSQVVTSLLKGHLAELR